MRTDKPTEENGVTRREALMSIGGVAAGAAIASSGVISSAHAAEEGSRAVKKEIDGIMTTTIGAVAGYRMLDTANYAEVISVRPIMKTVSVPREVCRDQIVEVTNPTKDPKQITGTVAGAVIGGVLGNQVGGGKGKTAATVAGAAAGGYAGNKIQEKMQDGNTHEESQQVCDTVQDTREEQQGYDVTYRLDGQDRMVHMDHDPGDRIAISNGELVLDP